MSTSKKVRIVRDVKSDRNYLFSTSGDWHEDGKPDAIWIGDKRHALKIVEQVAWPLIQLIAKQEDAKRLKATYTVEG